MGLVRTEEEVLKAISLHEPWASLIASGHKTLETRSWRPPKLLVGCTIAIHAAKRRPTKEDLYMCNSLQFTGLPAADDQTLVWRGVMV